MDLALCTGGQSCWNRKGGGGVGVGGHVLCVEPGEEGGHYESPGPLPGLQPQ